MIERFLAPRIAAALDDTPVVLLNGARQTGKTTLAKTLAGERAMRYLTFDDPTTLAASAPERRREGHSRQSLIARALRGGYPEPLRRRDERRQAWYSAYVATLVQRDIRDLANIEGLTSIPRLLRLLAIRSGSLVNFAELSRSSGLPQTTLKRYISLLEAMFLLSRLPAWSANLAKRLTRAPKLFFNDPGLCAHLRGLTNEMVDDLDLGSLFEGFVFSELSKQLSWSSTRAELFHFRTVAGQEVDLVLEHADGGIVGLEVKAGSTLGRGDFRGLKTLQDAVKGRFRRGVILYSGTEVVSFGEDLVAMPMDMLWQSS